MDRPPKLSSMLFDLIEEIFLHRDEYGLWPDSPERARTADSLSAFAAFLAGAAFALSIFAYAKISDPGHGVFVAVVSLVCAFVGFRAGRRAPLVSKRLLPLARATVGLSLVSMINAGFALLLLVVRYVP